MVQETREATSSASERWEFRIGAPVYAADGTLGGLHKVVLSLGEQRVMALLVRDSPPPTDYLIPIEAVRLAEEDRIQLAWSLAEARERGRYEEQGFHTLERSLAGYAPGAAAVSLRGGARGQAAEEGLGSVGMLPIRAGLEVVALDGAVGRVRHVLVDAASGRVTHFVVHQGLLAARDRLVPMDWVSSVTAEVVTRAATRAEVSALPEYHPDEELAGKIVEAWMDDRVLQALLIYSDVRATVRDGVATLEGYVWSSEQRQRLAERAWGVAGVLDVRDLIVADEELEPEVLSALAEDPRTQGLSLQVKSYLGNVHLYGTVPDKETRDAAGEVAAQVPLVKEVIHLLQMSGVEEAEPGRVLEPIVGQKVLTRDTTFGRVYRVVISPRTRLVTGIVVEGSLPDPEGADPKAHPAYWPHRERKVVLPAWMIDWVDTAVILRVGALQAVRAPEFREQDFVPPDPSWDAPRPYRPQDLLLEIHPLTRPISEMSAEPSAPVAIPPPDAPPGAPMTWVKIVRGDRVYFHGGEAGRVDHLLLDPETRRATHLVVRGGHGLPKDTLVPVDWIRRVDADGVFVDVHREQMLALPPYLPLRPDEEIAASAAQEVGRRE